MQVMQGWTLVYIVGGAFPAYFTRAITVYWEIFEAQNLRELVFFRFSKMAI